MTYVSDIAFSDAVKAQQSKRGSRAGYEKMAKKSDWKSKITPELAVFLQHINSFYIATANKDGQPYIQHRGGPRGFLNVLDQETLAFADFSGNRQYITVGNLSENDKAHIFLMDYANGYRIKIWGRAYVVENDQELLERLGNTDYRARPERAILFQVSAWDVNCPQHIPQKVDLESVKRANEDLMRRVAELESEVIRLRSA